MYQNIIIVGGGRLGDLRFFRKKLAQIGNYWLICCDGGARHLAEARINPDVLIGDMDSIKTSRLAYYERQKVKVIRHPANKDFTDTALALDYAIGLSPKQIQIFGALGGRLDHALANLFLLIRGKEAGIKTCLLDEYCEAFVSDQETIFENATGCVVSLLALSPQVEGINLQGFAFPLIDGVLNLSESRGISNVISDNRAFIRIRSGNLLVIRYWQKNVFPEAV